MQMAKPRNGGEHSSQPFKNIAIDSNLSGTTFSECEFTDVEFTSSKQRLELTDVKFDNCNFEKGDVGVIFSKVDFKSCEFSSIKKKFNVTFVDCSFQSTFFTNSRLKGVSFEDCSFERVGFAGSDVSGVSFEFSAEDQVSGGTLIASKVTGQPEMPHPDWRQIPLGDGSILLSADCTIFDVDWTSPPLKFDSVSIAHLILKAPDMDSWEFIDCEFGKQEIFPNEIEKLIWRGSHVKALTVVGNSNKGFSFMRSLLVEMNIMGSGFHDVHFSEGEIRKLNLSGSDASNFVFRNAALRQLNLQTAKLRSVEILQSEPLAIRCRPGMHITGLKVKKSPGDLDFLNLADSKFPRVRLTDSEFVECGFLGLHDPVLTVSSAPQENRANFGEVHFESVEFRNCELSNSDFTLAHIIDCDFEGSILNGANARAAMFCNTQPFKNAKSMLHFFHGNSNEGVWHACPKDCDPAFNIYYSSNECRTKHSL
jgi:uncharacterized protein YjbI with pentapeptide repeats